MRSTICCQSLEKWCKRQGHIQVFSKKNIRTPELRILLYMLLQTIYIGITLKTQLKRYVNCWYVYNISFPTQLFGIPEYSQNLEKNLSATSIILINRYSTYVQEIKECISPVITVSQLMDYVTKFFFGRTEYTQRNEDCYSWHSTLPKMLDIAGF